MPPAWVWLVASALLASAWGFLERRVRLLAQGKYDPALGWERSNLLVRSVQGVVTLLLLVVFALSFWLGGWKIGLGALISGFVIASLF